MDHAGSTPPRSPLPPTPERQPTGSGPAVDDGWTPGHGDESHRAVAWRARTALRRADRALHSLASLGASVDRLDGTITTWSETWGARWAAAGRVLRWAAGIVGALALAGAARAVWIWLSTLHH